MKGDTDSSARGEERKRQSPSIPAHLSHRCGNVRVQAAPECGENEVLWEVEKRLGSEDVCLRTTGKPGITEEKIMLLRWIPQATYPRREG